MPKAFSLLFENEFELEKDSLKLGKGKASKLGGHFYADHEKKHFRRERKVVVIEVNFQHGMNGCFKLRSKVN